MEISAAEATLAASIANAARLGEPLAVWGNATKEKMLRPVQAARMLSTRELTGITLYAPKELVISARAGTPLVEIQRTLAEAGQHLIAEPPNFADLLSTPGEQILEQTLGGVVATNLSGPRRVAWGAMRDHVLGIRALNGVGEMIHSGGRVLKNVTGLDLCKLLTGSHGTLAVMTEITLKVLPAPERTGTLVLRGQNPRAAVASLSAALGSPYGVSGAAYLPAVAARRVGLDGAVSLVRVEDFAPSVVYRLERLRAELGGGDLLEEMTSRDLWRLVGNAVPLASNDGAVWRVSVRPSRGPDVLEAVEAAFGADGFLDWGGGSVWVAGPATAEAHAAVMAAARAAGGTWMLFRAPDSLRGAVAVVPEEVAALARIGARVKTAFDPCAILNPGRIRAGL